MDISVMLEQLNEHRYRATAWVPAPLVAEAPTREEAVNRIRAMIRGKLSQVEVIHRDVPAGSETNAWLTIAGTWRDHPDMDQVEENIRSYRREIDAAPDRL